VTRDELEAAVRRGLTERDRRRAGHLFRKDTGVLADNHLVDSILAAADTYAAAAPATGRRTAGKG
jgi:hypothetical protein